MEPIDQYFKVQDTLSLEQKFFTLLAKDWMLITIGEPGDFNTMTASWGSFGYLWNRPIATIFIRPQRHTFSYAERFPTFTLSFLPEQYREALNLCGTKSGRDIDKVKAAGITPLATGLNGVALREAHLVIECEKIYQDSVKPTQFTDSSIEPSIYALKDYHKFYIGHIKACYKAISG